MREERRKELADIGEQVSSGKMTINQARKLLGFKPNEDNGKSDQYIMSEKYYKKEIRDKIERQMNALENKMRGITESTGLRILDALYTLIDLLLMEIQYGADHEK